MQIRTSGIAYPIDDFTTDWPAAIKAEKIRGFLYRGMDGRVFAGVRHPLAYGKWKVLPWPTIAPLKDQQYGSDAGGSVEVYQWGHPTPHWPSNC